jgi:integrase
MDMKNNAEKPDMTRLVMPEPTKEHPLAQLDFIFERVKQVNPPSKANSFDNALMYYKRVFLANVHNYSSGLETKGLFYLREQWDSLALVRFTSFLDTFNVEGNPQRRASHTVKNLFYGLRTAMKYAASQGFIKGEFLHAVTIPASRAETTQNAAYSDEEMDSINNWLHQELNHAHLAVQAKGYERTGLGRDPRRDFSTSAQNPEFVEDEWKNWDNLRWFFENEMDCQISCKPSFHFRRYHHFYQSAAQYPGGYNQLLADWQVKPIVDLNIIMPLVLKLSLETGLNPKSLLNLTVDCFQEQHPLSGASYLQYYKARSQGPMEMHLSVYDKTATIREFKQGQANVIRKTIETIRQVTAPLRIGLTGPLADLLFIYKSTVDLPQSNGPVRWHVQSLNEKNAPSRWCRKQVLINKLTASNGSKLQLNLCRFRSTKIADMVRKGFDFFEIQTHFGHRSIKTTLGYIARHQLEMKAQKEISKAIKQIHDNILWQQATTPAYAGAAGVHGSEGPVVFKGFAADCRNVYDPPEEVKKLKSYAPGQVCSRYNMCLFCNNVVLMKHHLPALIAYQRQIQQSTDYNLTELPNPQHYERTLAVLASILTPETSEFSPKDLEWARAAAECSDEFIDPVVYRPHS